MAKRHPKYIDSITGEGLLIEDLEEIRRQCPACVYCGVPFDPESSIASIEHLPEHPPWGINDIAYCCKSCNSSRRDKSHDDWFQAARCQSLNISRDTVADCVKRWLSTRSTGFIVDGPVYNSK